MSTELQTNRYDQILRRVGGLLGPGAKVAEVIAELFPMIDVERVPGELLALGGTGLAWGNAVVVAVPAVVGRVQLFNPVDSGAIITCSQVSAVGGGYTFGVTNIALAALQATRGFRDSRFGFLSVPIGEVRQDTIAAASPNHFRLRTDLLISGEFTDENSIAVLTPGFGLNISSLVLNSQVEVAFMWRERAIEPSELLELG